MGVIQKQFSIVFFGLQILSLVGGEPRPDWMKATLTSHFSEPRHHLTNPQYKMEARQFIESQFRDMGLTTVSHTFNTDRDDVKGVNVIGILKGIHFNTSNDAVVAISAHYDTMRNTPGVNDNGAAVAVMLEAARELALNKPRIATVLFIAFDFEEWESEGDAACSRTSLLCGSSRLVSDWLPSYFHHWPVVWKGLANMDTVLNFDDREDTQKFPHAFDILFPVQLASIESDQREGDFLTVAGRSPEDLQILDDFNSSWTHLGHKDFEIEMFPLPANILQVATDFSRSDHASFWAANLSALFLTDSANFRGYMRQCYHAECDNITFATDERLQFAAKISNALMSWVNDIAPPADTNDASHLWPCRFSTFVAFICVTVMSRALDVCG